MIIVTDANIIIAALLGSRGKLTILTSQNHKFFAPRKIIEEIKKYEKEICQKVGCTSEEFKENLEALLFFIEAIKTKDYENYLEKSKTAIKDRDSEDADYIACALHVKADFIWTEDKDFSKQNLVKIKTTEEFIEERKIREKI